ncbi:endonuclease domain-containing protein [Streptomyces sp. TLI_053]|uniref:endonuclease domain-containing protein n=1 Tax=Streptomyces sp. TLI_053 TaxID=1855352 RepID=UPI000B859667|nr:endonuclease domain-containing protein [Streptomyces sp. TLI_053]
MPEHFQRKRFAEHDFVFVGHVPVRAHKRANRWQFDEDEVRAAGRTIAALPWDLGDLLDPRLHRPGEQEPATPPRTGWRERIRRWADHAALAARMKNGCPCGTPCRRSPDGWALPCGLTPESLLQRCANHSIACLLPLPALVWSRDTWTVPRTLALVLDQWEQADTTLAAGNCVCGTCGTHNTDPTRHTPAADGWKVLCPTCATADLRRYDEELAGTTYARVREQGPRAEDFLCTMCSPARPAAAWDHCHEHGLIRGPLCGNCNTQEAQGMEFLARHGSVRHLLRCKSCRAQLHLPPHHRIAALRRHLHLERGLRGCETPMHMCVSIAETSEGGYEYRVRCFGQRASSTVSLTAAEADHILARTVESGML